MNLGAKVSLNNFVTFIDGAGRHPDIDAKLRHVCIPHVLFHVKGSQFWRKAKVTADGLTDVDSIEGSCHGIHNVVRDRPVELVSMIKGCHKRRGTLQNRTHQKFDPFRSDAHEIGIHHGCRLGL